jgi:hypothetical protein
LRVLPSIPGQFYLTVRRIRTRVAFRAESVTLIPFGLKALPSEIAQVPATVTLVTNMIVPMRQRGVPLFDRPVR